MNPTCKSLRDFYPDRLDVPILLGLSFIILISGLSLPLITVEKSVFWRHWENHYSVFTGVVELAIHGDWLLAVIVFFFSMVFPFLKLGALALLWFGRFTNHERKRTLHWLGVLGKWSMLDVFAVAILIVAAKLRSLTEVQPRIGIYLFGFAIILSMLSTMRVTYLAQKARAA
ncbi:MAG: paraquat-inducible protein A [Candidatus Omnitrophica bacterium]|nr:paraquat-inducible protein A [Candidatus Omnitrophota bacterium]